MCFHRRLSTLGSTGTFGFFFLLSALRLYSDEGHINISLVYSPFFISLILFPQVLIFSATPEVRVFEFKAAPSQKCKLSSQTSSPDSNCAPDPTSPPGPDMKQLHMACQWLGLRVQLQYAAALFGYINVTLSDADVTAIQDYLNNSRPYQWTTSGYHRGKRPTSYGYGTWSPRPHTGGTRTHPYTSGHHSGSGSGPPPGSPRTTPYGTRTPPWGTGTPPWGTGTPPWGTGAPPWGTGTRPRGTRTPSWGTGTPPAGTGKSPRGTGSRSWGSGTPPWGTGTPPYQYGTSPHRGHQPRDNRFSRGRDGWIFLETYQRHSQKKHGEDMRAEVPFSFHAWLPGCLRDDRKNKTYPRHGGPATLYGDERAFILNRSMSNHSSPCAAGEVIIVFNGTDYSSSVCNGSHFVANGSASCSFGQRALSVRKRHFSWINCSGNSSVDASLGWRDHGNGSWHGDGNWDGFRNHSHGDNHPWRENMTMNRSCEGMSLTE